MQLQLHHTTLITLLLELRLQLHYNYNYYNYAALHYTTQHYTTATAITTALHQWIRSAIHTSQQLTSPKKLSILETSATADRAVLLVVINSDLYGYRWDNISWVNMVYIYIWINIDYYFWSQLVPWFSQPSQPWQLLCLAQIGPSRMSRASKTKRSEPGAVPGRPSMGSCQSLGWSKQRQQTSKPLVIATEVIQLK